MMHMWASLFGIFILSAAIQGKAVDEKWKVKQETYRKECIAELEIPSDEAITVNETLAKLTLEEFTPKQRCLVKCIAEKFTGASIDDVDEFYKKGYELMKEASENLSKKKMEVFMEAIEKCRGTKGENSCDTMVLIHLCEKAIILKYGLSLDED